MVDVNAAITAIWPVMEAVLSTGLDYPTIRDQAVARAKRDLYGTATVPATLPDAAAYWVADQAVLYLIPAARDFIIHKQVTADSLNNASKTYYDKLAALDALKAHLEASTAEGLAAAQAVSPGFATVPAVSVAGLLVDPDSRALGRGVP